MAEETRCLRWLHLSELHVGARGEAAWWTVLDDLWRSLDEWLPRRGPPHAVLLTGDLASSGLPGEYDRLDRFLDRLLARLGRPEPTLVAVPGNHDVRRPKDPLALTGLRWLREYEADDDAIRDVRRLLWERRKAEAVPPLFEAWQAWAGRRLRPTHASFFPGDTTTVLEGDGGLTVAVVGLNSAWTQYTGGSFERLLQLEAEQLLAALPEPEAGGAPLDLFERCDRAMLLLHHPPAWLSTRAERVFRELVYPPTRFDLCLYGHLHRARSELTSVGGRPARAWFQAPSLFGLEGYGTAGESRSMGYAWGELLGDGEVRVWPLDRVLRADGSAALDVDPSFERLPEGYVQLRPPEVSGGDEAGVGEYRRWTERIDFVVDRVLPSASAEARDEPVASLPQVVRLPEPPDPEPESLPPESTGPGEFARRVERALGRDDRAEALSVSGDLAVALASEGSSDDRALASVRHAQCRVEAGDATTAVAELRALDDVASPRVALLVRLVLVEALEAAGRTQEADAALADLSPTGPDDTELLVLVACRRARRALVGGETDRARAILASCPQEGIGPPALAALVHMKAHVALAGGALQDASSLFEEAHQRWSDLGERAGEAAASAGLAVVSWQADQPVSAERWARRARALARVAGPAADPSYADDLLRLVVSDPDAATEDADGQVPGLDARAVREWLGRGYLLSAGIADWVATAGGWEAVAPRLQRSLAAAGATAGLDAVLASLTTADDEETPP